MADETLITWDLANWITVTLMVSVTFLLAGVVVKVWQRSRGGASNAG